MSAPLDVDAEARRVLGSAPQDRWEQLGLAPGCSAATVKRAFKRLCALHPDKNAGNPTAAAAFATVAAAYQVCAAAAASPPPARRGAAQASSTP